MCAHTSRRSGKTKQKLDKVKDEELQRNSHIQVHKKVYKNVHYSTFYNGNNLNVHHGRGDILLYIHMTECYVVVKMHYCYIGKSQKCYVRKSKVQNNS